MLSRHMRVSLRRVSESLELVFMLGFWGNVGRGMLLERSERRESACYRLGKLRPDWALVFLVGKSSQAR